MMPCHRQIRRIFLFFDQLHRLSAADKLPAAGHCDGNMIAAYIALIFFSCFFYTHGILLFLSVG